MCSADLVARAGGKGLPQDIEHLQHMLAPPLGGLAGIGGHRCGACAGIRRSMLGAHMEYSEPRLTVETRNLRELADHLPNLRSWVRLAKTLGYYNLEALPFRFET